jgi:alpha-mannosidase
VKYITFALPVQTAREINAAEEPTPRAGDLRAPGSQVQISLRPYQPRTFALRFRMPDKLQPNLNPLGRAIATDTRITATPIDLPFNLDGISSDANRGDGDFDGKGQTLAAELLPADLSLDGLTFKFGSSANGALNVLTPAGQTLKLPEGNYNRVYLLAASVGGDVTTEIAGQPLTIREWQGPVGQWDSRLKEPRQLHEVSIAPMTRGQTWTAEAINQDMVVQYDATSGAVSGMDQIRRGFVKRDEIAWVGTHRHDRSGNQPYIASYLFLYAIDMPVGARELRLPNDNRIRIMAMTAAREPYRLWPATTLYSSDLPTQ